MKKEDKQLLLVDLCARLPYGVKCYNADTESVFILSDVADINSGYPTFDYGYGELVGIKPYLRPMSSMTEEEKFIYEGLMIGTNNVTNMLDVIDWLNAFHFDYRGLIPMGLAIEVTESNNPYK